MKRRSCTLHNHRNFRMRLLLSEPRFFDRRILPKKRETFFRLYLRIRRRHEL